MSRLAFFGGSPVVAPGSLQPEWPIVTKEDIYAVVRVLESGRFTGIYHEENEALEQAYAAYVGAKHCLTYVNGTVVLHGAVAAAGIGPGDEVLVPALTFLASASSVMFHQGIPIFVDIDPVTFNMDPAAIDAAVTDHTRAIMVVHLHGLPCDMDEINAVARRHNLVVIEDNAHAAGADYKGVKTGNLADMAGGSLIMGKNLPTCGEGGLFTTNNDIYRDVAAKLREFGELYPKTGDRAYNPDALGWNYRINVINAAFTLSQLQRLDDYSRLRQENVAALNAAIADLPAIVPPHVPPDRTHVYHIYRLTVAPERMGIDVPAGRFRRALQDIVCAEGLPVGYYERMPVPAGVHHALAGHGGEDGTDVLGPLLQGIPPRLSPGGEALVYAEGVGDAEGPFVRRQLQQMAAAEQLDVHLVLVSRLTVKNTLVLKAASLVQLQRPAAELAQWRDLYQRLGATHTYNYLVRMRRGGGTVQQVAAFDPHREERGIELQPGLVLKPR